MKRLCTYIAMALAAVLQAAYVPTEWQVRVGPKATVFQAERYHGDGLALRATLTTGGQPLPYQGTARLYAQTNGMGAAWWDLAAATVSSNVLSATWLPEYDTGADVVDVFLGAPGNYQAHARIRFLPSPGATPGTLPLPTPVLNFADVQVLNPPYYTQAETDARIVELSPAAQPPGNYLAVSNAAMSAAAQADLISATNALAVSTTSALGSYLPLSGGMLSGDLAFSGSGAIAYTGVWGVRLYANAGAAGNRIYTNEGDTWLSERGLAWFDETTNHVHAAAVAATNYTNASISPTNPAFAAAVRNVPIAGADASDLAEIAEYGSYGTAGAAILALIAGLAALKRGKLDSSVTDAYSFAVDSSGHLTVTDSQSGAVYTFAGPVGDPGDVARGEDLPYVTGVIMDESEGVYFPRDRAVNSYEAADGDTTLTLGMPEPMPVDQGGRARDFILDVDNSANTGALGIEFNLLGEDYALAVTDGDNLAEITELAAGERARFYFTETAQRYTPSGAHDSIPVISIQRMTIEVVTTQGGA